MPENVVVAAITLLSIGWISSMIFGTKWTGIMLTILGLMYGSWKIGSILIM